MRLQPVLLVGTGLLAGVVEPARAQNVMEEIVVTARKTEESLQDAPLTITAFSDEQLESLSIATLEDLQLYTPGMSFFSFGNRTYGQITFRGMNNASINDPTQENASLFVDGVYYPGSIPSVVFNDLGRIEVIKGPQSAMFGRATFSGAINLVTAEPADEFRGTIRGRAAEYADYDVSLSLEGPVVSDRLAGRVYASYHDFGGDYRNALTGGRIGEEQDVFTSATFVLKPADEVNIKATVSNLDQRDGAPARQILGIPFHNCGPFGGVNRGGNARLVCGTVRVDPDVVALNPSMPAAAKQALGYSKDGLDRSFKFGNLIADWDFADGYTLSSLTGYSDEEFEIAVDGDSTPTDNRYNYQNSDQTAFSQELHVSSPQEHRLKWLAGGSYFRQRRNFISRFIFGPANPAVIAGTSPNGQVQAAQPNNKVIKNHSLFGSIGYDITDQLSVSAEARWQKDRVDTVQQGANPLVLITKSFLPRFIVDYKPADNVTFYANVAKGNKPTQANAEVAQFSDARRQILADTFSLFFSVPEETAWNYEIGIKTIWMDGRLNLDAAAFYIDWKGKQGRKVVQFDWNGNGRIDTNTVGNDREQLNSQLFNAGDARNIGFEAAAQLALTERWAVGGNVSYVNNKFENLQDETYFYLFGTFDVGDSREGRVPQWNGSVNTSYQDRLTESLDWFVRGDVAITGNRWEYFFNRAKTGVMKRVNLQVGVENETISVAAYGKNVFDSKVPSSIDRTLDSAFDPTNRAQAVSVDLPDRRQFGVKASYQF